VLAFDTYHSASECPVPYVAVGRGETALWEQPWLAINTSIPALASVGSSITHDYNVSTDSGKITVSLDGVQILAGDVSVSSIAYFYVTSSAGGKSKNLVISNMSNGAGITGLWNVHAGWSVVAEFSSEFRPSSSSQGSLTVFSFLAALAIVFHSRGSKARIARSPSRKS